MSIGPQGDWSQKAICLLTTMGNGKLNQSLTLVPIYVRVSLIFFLKIRYWKCLVIKNYPLPLFTKTYGLIGGGCTIFHIFSMFKHARATIVIS